MQDKYDQRILINLYPTKYLRSIDEDCIELQGYSIEFFCKKKLLSESTPAA
jgi:hypothetical protein